MFRLGIIAVALTVTAGPVLAESGRITTETGTLYGTQRDGGTIGHLVGSSSAVSFTASGQMGTGDSKSTIGSITVSAQLGPTAVSLTQHGLNSNDQSAGLKSMTMSFQLVDFTVGMTVTSTGTADSGLQKSTVFVSGTVDGQNVTASTTEVQTANNTTTQTRCSPSSICTK